MIHTLLCSQKVEHLYTNKLRKSNLEKYHKYNGKWKKLETKDHKWFHLYKSLKPGKINSFNGFLWEKVKAQWQYSASKDLVMFCLLTWVVILLIYCLNYICFNISFNSSFRLNPNQYMWKYKPKQRKKYFYL